MVGTFNEVDGGILTPEQVKLLEKRSGKKVKLVSLEEAARQQEEEKEALLYGMPEDAALMIQGQQGAPLAKTNSINLSVEKHSNHHYMLEQPEEDLVKQNETNK